MRLSHKNTFFLGIVLQTPSARTLHRTKVENVWLEHVSRVAHTRVYTNTQQPLTRLLEYRQVLLDVLLQGLLLLHLQNLSRRSLLLHATLLLLS